MPSLNTIAGLSSSYRAPYVSKSRHHARYSTRKGRYRVDVIVYCLVLSFCVTFLVPYWLPFSTFQPSSSISISNVSFQKKNLRNERSNNSSARIAICIPYLSLNKNGPQFPPYFPLFLRSAQGLSSLIDFLIFYTGNMDHYDGSYHIPSNVKMIQLQNVTQLAMLLSRVVVDQDATIPTTTQTSVISWMEKFLPMFPYLLVEYKPAYGHIFQQYLSPDVYSHWGYSDFDIVWGDLTRWITKEELEDFDIVTYGFGDQDRVYLRGQFTFHKNNPKINNLWRSCEYLSHFDQRVTQHETPKLESAEGCYSHAILQYNDIRVKYAVKAFTDAESQKNILTKHGLYLGLSRDGDRTILYTAGNNTKDGASLVSLPTDWFDRPNLARSYVDRTVNLQQDIGEHELILRGHASVSNCMYWVRPVYQNTICLDKSLIDSQFTIYWIDGKLYKQRYVTINFPGHIQTAPFFHFQEWKRTYTRSSQFTAIGADISQLEPRDRFQGWILLPEGLIPILPSPKVQIPLYKRLNGWKKISQTKSGDGLPNKSYCLRWIQKQVEYAQTTFCTFYLSWNDSSKIDLIQIPLHYDIINIEADVTLALTLELSKEQVSQRNIAENLLTVAVNNLELWKDHPCVLLVYVAETNNWIRNLIRETFANKYSNCLIGAIFSDVTKVSRKALLNMVYDASPTRWTISGIELERGLVLSSESLLFVQRAIKSTRTNPGSIFVIPQYLLMNDSYEENRLLVTSFFQPSSIVEVLRRHEQNSSSIVSHMVGVDCHVCQGSSRSIKGMNILDEIWWKISSLEINPDPVNNSKANNSRSIINEGLKELAQLLTTQNLHHVVDYDNSPILLIDALGPENGMLTGLLSQEVDEFAGSRCMNALRLAQLVTLGYHIRILSGAFASTSPRFQPLLCPVGASDGIHSSQSRCDGCFLFDHKDLFRVIAREEAVRPSKTALLGYERNLGG